MLKVFGAKDIVAPTVTDWLAEVYPGAVALMLADPKFTPVTCGCTAGTV
jgi:hypothetical protein